MHVTHGQDEAMALTDIMVVIDGRERLIEASPPQAVFKEQQSHFMRARFIGGHNSLRPTCWASAAARWRCKSTGQAFHAAGDGEVGFTRGRRGAGRIPGNLGAGPSSRLPVARNVEVLLDERGLRRGTGNGRANRSI